MRRIFVSALLLLSLGATGSRAETEQGSETTPRKLKDSILVTANRFGLEPAKSVWPVKALPENRLEGEASLEPVLDGWAGADVRQSNGVGSVTTLSNWGTFNRHVLLLYDGRVVKDYSLGGFNLAEFSPDEFERVEFLKGPQSAFYGADAVGGVLNLIPKNALLDRIEMSGKYGNQGHRQVRLDVAHTIDGSNLGFGGFAEATSVDNSRDNAGTERLLFGVRSDLLSSDDRHRLSISARYFDDSLGSPGPVPDPTAIPVYGNSEANSLTDYQQDQNYSVDLSYRYHDSRIGEARIDAFWEKKNLDYHSLYNYQSFYYTDDTVLNVDSVDVVSRSIYNKRSSGISGRLLHELRNVSVALGVDWLSGSLRATSDDTSYATTIVGPAASSQYKFNLYNFWSQGQNQFHVWSSTAYEPTGQIRLDLSGRLQFIRNRDTQTSYNAGIVLTPVDLVSVKFGYGYAFRLPTIAEQFADDVYTQGNTDLSPETSRSFNGTLSFASPNGRIRSSATVFHQTVDSLIQYQYSAVIYRSVPRNVDEFRTTGVDLSLDVRPLERLWLGWSGVIQNAEQTRAGDGEYVSAFYVPEVKWRLDVDTKLERRVDLNLNVTYTSDRNIVLSGGSPKTIDRVYEFGMSIAARVTDQMKIRLTGYDLTDRARPDQFGFTPGDGDYPSPGRRLLLDVTFALK